ncbi:MAG: HD domain-containing protein [Acidimicrobiales bacterium]
MSEPDPILGPRFGQAAAYAAEAHAHQARKCTQIPYVSHLFAVASIVLEMGGTEDGAIAALLHDAVEDQGGEERRVDIEATFGANVAAIVQGCSAEAKEEGLTWRQRKERYLAHLAIAPQSVLTVSLADKVHNLRSIAADRREVGERVWKRFNAGRDEQGWYYRSLAAAYRGRVEPGSSLSRFVDELDRLLTEVWPD